MDTIKKICLMAFSLALVSISLNAQDSKLTAAFRKSYTHEAAGEYSRAVESLKQAYDENNYYVNLRLGWLNYMGGAFTESAAFYQKALRLMPLSTEARLGLVLPLSALGNWEQVIAQYIEILKYDPGNSTANYRLGAIYYNRSEYQKAHKHLETVVNHYPFDYDALILSAWNNLKMGKLQEAKVLFNNALLYKPDDESAKEGLGLIK